MRNAFVLLSITCFVLLVFAAATVSKHDPGRKPETKEAISIGCGPTTPENILTDENGKYTPVLPGWGKYTYPISTQSDSAQFYFNQGLNLYYSYHLKQAVASFKEAARFDKTCAMAYWGQALASGPYYNSPVYTMGKDVPEMIKLMNDYSTKASDSEKELMEAMQQRYATTSSGTERGNLDQAYAAALASLMQQYPGNNDLKMLYVDAVMLQHKWDFWYNNGSPKQWTPELVKLCEQVVKTDPTHPGALHYYIHLTEASKHPEVALTGANALKDAMPGTAHMVHMASHVYQRTGNFAEGVYVNEKANAASNVVDSLAPILGDGQNAIVHYYAVQSYCAMNAGMYNKAKPMYMRARNRAQELNGPLENLTYPQFVYMMPVMAAVRLGKWEDILAAEPVNRKWKFAVILEDFARGMAYVHTKDYPSAQKALQHIEANMGDNQLDIRRGPFNKPVQMCRIAAGILRGTLNEAQGKPEQSIAAYTKAIVEEDSLVYCEPQDWLLPARHYLGNLLLKLNRVKEAEAVYKEDLNWHPGNGWSLLGLQKCATLQNKKTQAASYQTAIRNVFRDADEMPGASVF